MEAVSIQNLKKTYDKFQLKDISFSVPYGSIVGFIGENGAGKSTTIKALLNIIRRDSGNISILGMDIDKEEKKIKEQVGVVLDECNFHDNLKVETIPKFMKNIYKHWENEIFYHYLEKFKLPADKKVKEYSRGMKMKLSIAAALAHKPKLLVLDEATSGLDPIVREEILDIFMDFIQDEEHSILMSSHITSDLDKVADYIAFIQNGEMIFVKEKDYLLEHYGIARCTKEEWNRLQRDQVLQYREGKFNIEALVEDKEKFLNKNRGIVVDSVTLEEIMVFYVKGNIYRG